MLRWRCIKKVTSTGGGGRLSKGKTQIGVERVGVGKEEMGSEKAVL